MKSSGWIQVGVISCVAVFAAVHVLADNPYEKVVERNIFGLKPIPPPPPPPPPPTPPVPKITLQGITSILGYRQVLFKALTLPGPGTPIKEQSYILSEGQREDDIEVLAIDEQAGTVKFNNHGTEQLLDMKTDSAKATPGAALPPAKAPLPVPVFSQNSQQGGPEEENPALRRVPQRPIRTPEEDNDNNNNAGNTSAQAAPAAPAATASAGEEAPLSQEEQSIVIELNHQKMLDEVRAGRADPVDAAIYPPTELSQPGDPGVPDPNNPADNPPSAK